MNINKTKTINIYRGIHPAGWLYTFFIICIFTSHEQFRALLCIMVVIVFSIFSVYLNKKEVIREIKIQKDTINIIYKKFWKKTQEIKIEKNNVKHFHIEMFKTEKFPKLGLKLLIILQNDEQMIFELKPNYFLEYYIILFNREARKGNIPNFTYKTSAKRPPKLQEFTYNSLPLCFFDVSSLLVIIFGIFIVIMFSIFCFFFFRFWNLSFKENISLIYQNIATFECNDNKNKQAIKSLKTAEKFNPDKEVYYRLGFEYLEIGDSENALINFKKSQNLAIEDTACYKGTAFDIIPICFSLLDPEKLIEKLESDLKKQKKPCIK